jgi:hypothetical protein
MNQLIEECYQREESANDCCIRALKRLDFKSAVDCNEAAYRSVINRYLLTTGKAKQKALSDLKTIREKYELFTTQLNNPEETA